MQKKKKNKSLIIGICIILIGIIIGIIPIFVKQKRTKTENIKVDDYINNTSIINNNHHDEDIINSNNNIDINDTKEKYIMVIEIPKLKLKRGIYPLGSKLNSIEYNIELLKGSIMPNVDNSNLILAAHNGNSRVSYFNNLYKLKINDYVNIYYNGVKYIYKLDKMYDVEKDGDVEVFRDLKRNTLTLITCKKEEDDKQIVLILYLDKKQNY